MTCIDLMSKRSRRKPFKATQNSKRDQIPMNLHRFDVQMIKNVELRRKIFKTTQNYEIDPINLHYRFDVQMIKNVELRRKIFKTTQNYEIDQITMNCIHLTSKRSKMLSYVAKRFKTTTLNYKSDQKTMTCIDLMSKRSKQRKTPNAIKFRWICIDLTSKWSKMLSYVANHSKPLNYESDQIGRQNDLKCWVTSQNIQNYAKLRNRSNYNELHPFDVKTI